MPKKNAHTSKDMGSILGSQIEFNPVTVSIVNNVQRRPRKGPYQSKSKGMASGLMLALKTFLNSSKVIVPELSLWGISRYTQAQSDGERRSSARTRRNTGRRRSNPRQASSVTSRTPRNLPKTPNHALRYPRHGTRWRIGVDRFSSNPPRERWP